MSKTLAWLLGLGTLVMIGVLLACGSNYNPASDGLVIVASQGAGLIQTFSFNLSSGSIADVSNSVGATASETCQIAGIPGSLVLNPAGTYAFAIINASTQCPGSQTGIESFVVNSNGTIPNSGTGTTVTSDPNPVAIAMDPSGDYLYVAEGTNSLPTSPNATPCPGTTAQYAICVYAIGSTGGLTPVPSAYNFVPPTGYPNGFPNPNITALTTTPISFNFSSAVCSGSPNATQEFLYAVDSQNNLVYEYAVEMSSGTLQNPDGASSSVLMFPTGSYPFGVAVDPCNRFVYVSDWQSNQVSAYTICNGSATQSSSHCPIPPATPDGSLVPVVGSPFSLTGSANGPGPLLVDALGNYLFVLNELSNTISPLAISPVTGSIAGRTVYNTGNQPKQMVLRSDDSWLFVTNYNSPTLSQYAVVPSTGALVPVPATITDNYPWGVAVK